jgi:hypothetical protein
MVVLTEEGVFEIKRETELSVGFLIPFVNV